MIYIILTCLQLGLFGNKNADVENTFARSTYTGVACTSTTCVKVAGTEGVGSKNILVKGVFTNSIYSGGASIGAHTCYDSGCIRVSTCSGSASIEAAIIGDARSVFLRGASVKNNYIKDGCFRNTFTKSACIKDACNKGANAIKHSKIHLQSF